MATGRVTRAVRRRSRWQGPQLAPQTWRHAAQPEWRFMDKPTAGGGAGGGADRAGGRQCRLSGEA